MEQAKTHPLYLRISQSIAHQIRNDVLKVGDKLPSIRQVCREHGVSMSTALQAYYELERQALIEARPQSGYYVRFSHRRLAPAPTTSNPPGEVDGAATEELITRVYADLGTDKNLMLSLGVPAPQLLPLPKLNKALAEAMRRLPANGTSYDQVQGNSRLRRQVARWSFAWEGRLKEDDIVTTAGCMNALAYGLMTLTEKGDTIATESPVYFGVLQLAKSLGLNVLELPTNPITGIEPDALKHALVQQKIKLCLLVSNFSNPLGSCMPDEHKKAVVEMMTHYNVPLIEDDLYGDIYFDQHRPRTCKTFDDSGIVLWCSSVSKTLAPGYRVGWIAPGRFRNHVIRTKLFHSVSANTLMQEATGAFLEAGRHEHHLRKLRQVLHANAMQYLRAISEYFPEGTRVSRPRGGFLLWVELPGNTDAGALYERALKYNISIAPGRMFTLQNQYNNCLRLSFGLQWNEQVESALQTLGILAKKLVR